MAGFFSKFSMHKTLHYIFAYVLFALFAILGLEVIVNLHQAIFRISMMVTTRIGVGNFFYVWGGFLLFALYAIAIVPLETLMNRAARTGRVLAVGARVFAIEAGLALLIVIAPLIARLLLVK